MGIAADILSEDSGLMGWQAALAALEWHVEAGALDVLQDEPLNRYDLPEKQPDDLPATPAPAAILKAPLATPAPRPKDDAQGLRETVAQARQGAASASTINELRDSLTAFDGCDLKRGARGLVFAQGNPAAHVMVIGDPPRRIEDMAGLPFQGPEGDLLDAMFAAIGLTRDHHNPAQSLYLAPCLPWPTPLDRDPDAAEIDQIRPFIQRHIALAKPQVLVLMGNSACQMVLDQSGIHRLRGTWLTHADVQILPMFSPRWLLKHPAAKREAWADLLSLKACLAP